MDNLTFIIVITCIFILFIYILPKPLIYLVENLTGIVFTLRQPYVINQTKSKKIAITINDIIKRTNHDNYDDFKRFKKILDLAEKYNITLNLFITASEDDLHNIELNQLKRATKTHLLANRGTFSYCHAKYNELIIEQDLIECKILINSIYNSADLPSPYIFYRPYYYILTPIIDIVIDKLNMTTVLGNIYPYDYWIPFPSLIYWYIRLKLEHNDIIILHDTPHLYQTLEKLFPYLIDNNFETVTLECLNNKNIQTPSIIPKFLKQSLITIYSVCYYIILVATYNIWCFIYQYMSIIMDQSLFLLLYLRLKYEFYKFIPDVFEMESIAYL